MAKHLQRDLDNLQRDLIALAGLVEGAIHQSVRALCERNAQLAREVIAGDTQVDDAENQIEEECLKLLALYQPVAIDLRRITAAMMINVDLERMGDRAEEIAERAVHLESQPPFFIPARLQVMADLTSTMVRQSLDAFVNRDAARARQVCRRDDEVDRCNAEVIQEIITLMKADPSLIEGGLSLFSATRHLERIADHATNIAEDVVYLIEGEIIRHRPAASGSRSEPET